MLRSLVCEVFLCATDRKTVCAQIMLRSLLACVSVLRWLFCVLRSCSDHCWHVCLCSDGCSVCSDHAQIIVGMCVCAQMVVLCAQIIAGMCVCAQMVVLCAQIMLGMCLSVCDRSQDCVCSDHALIIAGMCISVCLGHFGVLCVLIIVLCAQVFVGIYVLQSLVCVLRSLFCVLRSLFSVL